MLGLRSVRPRSYVPKSAVALDRGGQSRTKMLTIDGLTDDELHSRLTDL